MFSIEGENKMNNKKVICSCFKVTIQDLKDAIENGAESFKEVKAATKVSTSCKKCKDNAKSIVKELLAK